MTSSISLRDHGLQCGLAAEDHMHSLEIHHGMDARETRRRDTRWADDAQVKVFIHGEAARGWLLNLSRGGCCVLVDHDGFASNRKLDLVGFSVVVKSVQGAEEARVVWSRVGSWGAVMGLAF